MDVTHIKQSSIGDIVTWITAGGAIVQLIVIRRALLTRLKPRLRVGSRMAQGYVNQEQSNGYVCKSLYDMLVEM